jgi:hypothetical protein
VRGILPNGLVPLIVAGVRIAIQALRGGAIGPSLLLAQPVLLIGFSVQIVVFGPLVGEAGRRGCDRMRGINLI